MACLAACKLFPDWQTRKGNDEAGCRVCEGCLNSGVVLLAPQTDNDRIAIQLLLTDLLAQVDQTRWDEWPGYFLRGR